MSTPTLNPRILEQAENAHGALLERFLAGFHFLDPDGYELAANLW
jgi:hypothetical protein